MKSSIIHYTRIFAITGFYILARVLHKEIILRHSHCTIIIDQGLTAYVAKGEPSFLSYFKTLSNGPALGIKPMTSHSTVKRSTD